MLRIVCLPALTAALLSLSACGGPAPTESTINTPESVMLPPQQANGSVSTLFTFGKNTNNGGTPQGTGIQVNAYIWRATLDTLSFMPLVSADPFGGVVITDWYSPPATPNERFKANAYILSSQMDANAIKVSLFHQILQNGQWQDADVDPNTVSGLEDRILARAADLKAEAENTRG